MEEDLAELAMVGVLDLGGVVGDDDRARVGVVVDRGPRGGVAELDPGLLVARLVEGVGEERA